MSTKQWFILLLILLTPPIGLIYYLNTYSARFYSPVAQVLKYHKELRTNKTSMLFLGDSTSVQSFSADYLPQDAYSLAAYGSTSVESYHSLIRFLNLNSNPKCAIISLSYKYQYKRDHAFWPFFVANDFYDFEELKRIYQKSRELEDFPGATYLPSWFYLKYLFYQTKLHSFSIKNFQESIFTVQNPFSFAFDIHLRSRRGFVFQQENTLSQKFYIDEYHAYVENEFIPAKTNDYYLQKMLSLLESKNVRIYFLNTPIAQSYAKKNQVLKFIKIKEDHFKDLANNFESVTFIEGVEVLPDEYFYNSDHLNKTGSETFTKKIIPLLDCD